MIYDLSLSGKKIVLISIIFVFMAMLLFTSGWITGAILSMPESARLATRPAVKEKPVEKPPEGAAVVLVKKPVPEKPESEPEKVEKKIEADSAPPEEEKTAQVKPEEAKEEAEIEKTEPDIAPKKDDKSDVAEVPQAQAEKPVVVKAAEPSADTPAKPEDSQENGEAEEAQPDSVPKDDETGVADQDAQSDENAIDEDEDIVFSVQVGSFVVKMNAMKMTDNLKLKGYKAAILNMRDSGDKLWYVVQIGDYKDSKTAFREASKFKEKEKIVAVVIPVASHLLQERKIPLKEKEPEEDQAGGTKEEGKSDVEPGNDQTDATVSE